MRRCTLHVGGQPEAITKQVTAQQMTSQSASRVATGLAPRRQPWSQTSEPQMMPRNVLRVVGQTPLALVSHLLAFALTMLSERQRPYAAGHQALPSSGLPAL